MAEFVKVATRSEIPADGGKSVEANGRAVALFDVDGTIHAIDATCMHAGGPLGEGALEGAVVTCPWHGWQYDVTTGKLTTGQGAGVACYLCKVEGEDVLVAV